MDLENRKKLTFEQAEGAEALPTQLKPKEISSHLKASIQAIFHSEVQELINKYRQPTGKVTLTWRRILYRHHIDRLHAPPRQFSDSRSLLLKLIDSMVEKDYLSLYGFLQFVIRDEDCPSGIAGLINDTLERTRSAYRVFDGDTIAPIASEVEAQSLVAALSDLDSSDMPAARAHLKTAASQLSAGQWSDSIRESINAVESVSRKLAPGSTSLGPAISAIDKVTEIHSALRKGFSAIYGYTSDEQGIRHALVNEDVAKVGEDEAIFMLGACASFVSYLLAKGRAGGLL